MERVKDLSTAVRRSSSRSTLFHLILVAPSILHNLALLHCLESDIRKGYGSLTVSTMVSRRLCPNRGKYLRKNVLYIADVLAFRECRGVDEPASSNQEVIRGVDTFLLSFRDSHSC